jgi:hypothetical protein
MASMPFLRMGPPPRSFAADAHTASWFGSLPTEYKDVATNTRGNRRELPSTRHPDHRMSAVVLGAVKDAPSVALTRHP